MLRTATLSLLLASTVVSAQTITQQGFGWNPNLLTVTSGTTITVNIGGGHNMTEVSQTTWNAGGTTPLPGGFQYSPGTHQLTLTIPGTYYYLCTIHPSSMKGRIIVEASTGVAENQAPVVLDLTPNPADAFLTVTADPKSAKNLALIDMQGRTVLNERLTGSDRIAVSHLPNGQYVAVTRDEEGRMIEQRRINIQH